MPASIITVLAPKGGNGKTVLSTNLLVAALHDGLDVVAADADPQGSLVAWGEARASRGIEPAAEVVPLRLRGWAAGLRPFRRRDLVVVDTPPGAADADVGAMIDLARGSSVVLMPARAQPTSTSPMLGFGEVVAKTGVPVFYVLNEVTRSGLAAESRAMLRDTGRLAPVELPARTDLARLASLGLGAADAPRVPGAAEVAALWAWVAGMIGVAREGRR